MVDANSEKPRLHHPGILVVDDDPLIRKVLRAGLEREGFKVVLADGGREALDVYRQQQQAIEVVLLDVIMPGQDGPQTFDLLRQLNPEVLVCFMSGGTGAYDAEQLRARGARDFILKPFRLDDLSRRLWLVLRGVATDLVPAGKS